MWLWKDKFASYVPYFNLVPDTLVNTNFTYSCWIRQITKCRMMPCLSLFHLKCTKVLWKLWIQKSFDIWICIRHFDIDVSFSNIEFSHKKCKLGLNVLHDIQHQMKNDGDISSNVGQCTFELHHRVFIFFFCEKGGKSVLNLVKKRVKRA